MTTPQPDSRSNRARWWSGVGYLVFATGSVSGIWLAWRARDPQSDENPLAVLALVWMIAGMTQIFVRRFWRACVVSAVGSALGYFVFAVASTPNPFLNEMFGAGMIEVGLFGFVLSMLMGAPVAIVRRARTAERDSVRRIAWPKAVGSIGIIFGVVGIVGALVYFARPALLQSARELSEQLETTPGSSFADESEGIAARGRVTVPWWFTQYCIAIGSAGMIASILYLRGSFRLLRLREHGATLFMVGACAYSLVGASIVTAGLVSPSAAIREDFFIALGSVVTNGFLLLFVWKQRRHAE